VSQANHRLSSNWHPSGFESDARMKAHDLIALPSAERSKQFLSSTFPRPCHILFVIDQLKEPFGGAEQMLLKIITGLRPDRFRCSVLTFASNLSCHKLNSFPCPLHVFPLTRSYDLKAVRMAVRLARFIHTQQVHIVHSFFETSDLWAGSIVRLTSTAKLVSSRRDMGILRSGKHRLGYRILGPLAHKVLTVSEGVRQFAISEDHLASDKVVTLYNGIEIPRMPTPPAIASVRERLGIRHPVGRLVTTVGNIRKVKGLDVLIRAAALVCTRSPDVKFFVVGGISEWAYYNDLLQMIENFGLGDKFKFLGHQSDVFPLLCASDVFVLPSRSEGFSNALLEGMAAGVPCVATRVGGNAEAVQDGETGFLVEAEDASAMADRICRLIEDPHQAQQMGHAGRKRVSDHFSLEAMMLKLEAVYENLLRN